MKIKKKKFVLNQWIPLYEIVGTIGREFETWEEDCVFHIQYSSVNT